MHFTRLNKPKPSEVFDTYWLFASKRHEIFLKRLTDPIGPWTTDPVLQGNRFTNVFRAADRVSQFLIKLQYEQDLDSKQLFFLTILFKLFNKIETHFYLGSEVSDVKAESFSVAEYSNALTRRMAMGHTVYSAAYIMPSAGRVFGHKFKHTNHLALLKQMMDDNLDEKIATSKSLADVYHLLLAYPSIGKFLAFQYSIDLNYSQLIDFSEMDFVVAGPGAISGISKCFSSLGDYSYEDVIKLMADNQETYSERIGLIAPTLWGRRLQLIDCQNIFCEVDKYLRATRPDVGNSSRTRIKQKYNAIAREPLEFFFPPKWKLDGLATVQLA